MATQAPNSTASHRRRRVAVVAVACLIAAGAAAAILDQGAHSGAALEERQHHGRRGQLLVHRACDLAPYIDASRAGEAPNGIWRISLEDGPPVRVVACKEYVYNPVSSPDGTMVAFAECRPPEAKADLWIAADDGKSLYKLTEVERLQFVGGISWSPDSRDLAYHLLQSDAKMEWFRSSSIEIANVATRGRRHLAAGVNPAWSPVTDLIAVPGPGADPLTSELGPTSQAALMRSDGRTVVRLEPGGSAAWSPDGQRLLFVAPDNALVIRTSDGSLVARTTPLKSRQIAWSPDSHRIAVVDESHRDGEAAVSIAVLDSNALTEEPRRLRPIGGMCMALEWPLADTAVVTVAVDTEFLPVQSRVIAVRLDTGELTQLTDEDDELRMDDGFWGCFSAMRSCLWYEYINNSQAGL